jgi:hypothetical protein
MKSADIHLVCPRNGEPTRCPIDDAEFPHRREALVYPGPQPRLGCDTHKEWLVPVAEWRRAA